MKPCDKRVNTHVLECSTKTPCKSHVLVGVANEESKVTLDPRPAIAIINAWPFVDTRKKEILQGRQLIIAAISQPINQLWIGG